MSFFPFFSVFASLRLEVVLDALDVRECMLGFVLVREPEVTDGDGGRESKSGRRTSLLRNTATGSRSGWFTNATKTCRGSPGGWLMTRSGSCPYSSGSKSTGPIAVPIFDVDKDVDPVCDDAWETDDGPRGEEMLIVEWGETDEENEDDRGENEEDEDEETGKEDEADEDEEAR